MTKILETQRLLLRTFELNDAFHLLQLNSDPYVIKHTGDVPFTDLSAAEQFIRGYDQYNSFNMGRWVVELKLDGQFLGWCGLKYTPESNEVDLGFRFFRKFWNRGFASESAKACLDYGFFKLGIQNIVARARKSNQASIRVLEKIGMRFLEDFDFEGFEGKKYFLTKIERFQHLGFHFREAQADDIRQMQIVRNAVRQNRLSDPSKVTDLDVLNHIADKGKGWLCLWQEKVVGFAIANLMDNNIWALFVHPDFEGKGIGRHLHDSMMNWYFSQTKTRVWLSTDANTRAERFYRKLGWEQSGNLTNGELRFELNHENWKGRFK